ncbi:hypothetical protein JCM8115_004292 [Rhodotorula mucilaginosa]|uniref:EF-hand domain-containing protein n=1 Tax=Rhodotorula mucilaginosa TaxID=5537 RepID=A0A9P7B623_RHOMI|nr:hypothetical protein C6P46_003879 [Rhodotorula mucilaginosa]TKA51124.1 hypothetical protein B0A53_05942 [Rhodotorula sp. CCFEE 5036]
MAGSKSYASATSAYAPLGVEQPHPSLALLDSTQPANRDALLRRHPHALDGMDGEVDHQQNEACVKSGSARKTNGFEREHESDSKNTQGKKDSEDRRPGSGFESTIKGHPAMEGRDPPEKIGGQLVEPWVPRANIAATPDKPDGTQEGGWAKAHSRQSVLQQHCAWWDPDGDGIIWPWDVFFGFHQLGYALPWCILAVCIISPSFSWFTSESWIPHPLFPVNIKNIHRAKHGSDTATYDTEGRFVPARFEAIFSKFDHNNKGGVTFFEALQMIHRNRNILDFPGWVGEFFEWFATYLLIWPADGILRKEDIRVVYDGSVFPIIAARERQRRLNAWNAGWLVWLLSLLPLSGWFKENRAQTDVEYKKDKDLEGKGAYWKERGLGKVWSEEAKKAEQTRASSF